MIVRGIIVLIFFFFFVLVVEVELLIPQLQFLDDEGAQVELWELSRIFLESLMEESGSQVKPNKLDFSLMFN